MKSTDIHQLIRNRKSVYPLQFIERPITEDIIQELLESANWAPTHRITEPWRFKVITGPALKRLGNFLAEKYRNTTPLPQFSVSKYEKIKMNPIRSGAVLAICLKRDEKERVPEWEETASVAMAVQNIWIACQAHQIGGYWSTPDLRHHFHEFQPLSEGEQCLGFFYMGYYEPFNVNRPRKPINEKVIWVRD